MPLDLIIVAGVCLFTYGWSEQSYSADEQPYLVIGAGLVAFGVLRALRRPSPLGGKAD